MKTRSVLRTGMALAAVALVLGFAGHARAGTADAEVYRSPSPPDMADSDGTDAVWYEWNYRYQQRPDFFIELIMNPDGNAVRCLYHDILGRGSQAGTAAFGCDYTPEPWSWPNEDFIFGAGNWDVPRGAQSGAYNVMLLFYRFEDGAPVLDAQGTTTFAVEPVDARHDLLATAGELLRKAVFRPPTGTLFAADDSKCFPEECNGKDDDCDGLVDEDFPLLGQPCDGDDPDQCAGGHYECFPNVICPDPEGCDYPEYLCVHDVGGGTEEICDGLDNDCDGLIDEDFPIVGQPCDGPDPDQCEAGVWACEKILCNDSKACEELTAYVCIGDTQGPLPGPDAECDGIDQDCDGAFDEDFIPTTSTCGVGTCASIGMLECIDGNVVDTCSPAAPLGADDNCNLIDEDCDGTADEDYVASLTECGNGACTSHGQLLCHAGKLVNTCNPGSPGDDTDCDGIDDDCDGLPDNHFPDVETECGQGLCGSNGKIICAGGKVVDTCVPAPPGEEICNGIDDDCDGLVDEQGCPTCGNGLVEAGEACDDGAANADEPGMCQTDCMLSVVWPPSGAMTFAWEDLPLSKKSDWDYNDFVLSYWVELLLSEAGIVEATVFVDPEARGAGYNHTQGILFSLGDLGLDASGWYVVERYSGNMTLLDAQDPVPFGPDDDNHVFVVPDTWQTLPPNQIKGDFGHYDFDANTESGYGKVEGQFVHLRFLFDSPVPAGIEKLPADGCGTHGENIPFKVYLYPAQTHEVIQNGDIRFLCIPDFWEWPEEGAQIWNVYPGVTKGKFGHPVFAPGWYLDVPTGPVWMP